MQQISAYNNTNQEQNKQTCVLKRQKDLLKTQIKLPEKKLQILQKQISKRSKEDIEILKNFLISEFIGQFPYLEEFEKHKKEQIYSFLAQNLHYYFKQTGQLIINEYEESQGFFFILEGECIQYIKQQKDPNIISKAKDFDASSCILVNKLTQGDIFGQNSLAFDSLNFSTVISATNCHLGFLSKKNYKNILFSSHSIYVQKHLQIMYQVSLFSCLTEEILEKIYSLLQKVKMKQNQYLYNELDKTDAGYIILSGKFAYFKIFQLIKNQDSSFDRLDPKYNDQIQEFYKNQKKFEEIKISYLQQKDIVGEEDMKQEFNNSRQVSVKCVTVQGGSLLRIQKNIFFYILSQNSEILQQWRSKVLYKQGYLNELIKIIQENNYDEYKHFLKQNQNEEEIKQKTEMDSEIKFKKKSKLVIKSNSQPQKSKVNSNTINFIMSVIKTNSDFYQKSSKIINSNNIIISNNNSDIKKKLKIKIVNKQNQNNDQSNQNQDDNVSKNFNINNNIIQNIQNQQTNFQGDNQLQQPNILNQIIKFRSAQISKALLNVSPLRSTQIDFQIPKTALNSDQKLKKGQSLYERNSKSAKKQQHLFLKKYNKFNNSFNQTKNHSTSISKQRSLIDLTNNQNQSQKDIYYGVLKSEIQNQENMTKKLQNNSPQDQQKKDNVKEGLQQQKSILNYNFNPQNDEDQNQTNDNLKKEKLQKMMLKFSNPVLNNYIHSNQKELKSQMQPENKFIQPLPLTERNNLKQNNLYKQIQDKIKQKLQKNSQKPINLNSFNLIKKLNSLNQLKQQQINTIKQTAGIQYKFQSAQTQDLQQNLIVNQKESSIKPTFVLQPAQNTTSQLQYVDTQKRKYLTPQARQYQSPYKKIIVIKQNIKSNNTNSNNLNFDNILLINNSRKQSLLSNQESVAQKISQRRSQVQNNPSSESSSQIQIQYKNQEIGKIHSLFTSKSQVHDCEIKQKLIFNPTMVTNNTNNSNNDIYEGYEGQKQKYI